MSLGILGLSWWLSGKEPTWQCRTLWFDPLVWGLSWWLSSKEPTCQCRTLWSGPLIGKIPWRRKWQPTPVFLTGKSRNRGAWWAIVRGVAKSQTRLSDWTTVWFVNLPFLRIKCILGSGFCTCRWCVCLSVCGLMYIWDRRKPFRQVLVDSCFWLNFPPLFLLLWEPLRNEVTCLWMCLLFYCRVCVWGGTGMSFHLSVPKHLEVWAVWFICVSPLPVTLWVLVCSSKARPSPGRHPKHQMSLLLCVLFQKGQKHNKGSHSPETLDEDFREILSSLYMLNHCFLNHLSLLRQCWCKLPSTSYLIQVLYLDSVESHHHLPETYLIMMSSSWGQAPQVQSWALPVAD